MELAFGIDLGTTNSCIAVHNGKSASVLTLPGGDKTVPSCVMYDMGSVIVGRKAYEQRWKYRQVVYSCKKDMGTDTVYHINDGLGEFTVTPIDVSAEILKYLKLAAEARYEKCIEDVVITVPAYFNDGQKRDTLRAGKQAGFKTVQLLQEPTAAALAYSFKNKKDEHVIVYDLGGGTFDVSLLSLVGAQDASFSMLDIDLGETKRTIEVLDIAGDNHLGGDDFDYELFKDLCRKMNVIAKQKGAPPKFSFNTMCPRETKEKLLLAIEQAKKLFGPNTGAISIPVKCKVGEINFDEHFTLGTKEFASALRGIYRRTMQEFDKVLNRSYVKADKIILNGGSTKFEPLRALVRKDFPNTTVYSQLNPDESVALGAATLAARDAGMSKVQLNDITPMNIGIAVDRHEVGVVSEGAFQVVIPKGSTLPCKNLVRVFTESPEQTIASVDVYEGQSSLAHENTLLGTMLVTDITPKDKDRTTVLVELRVDINGILHVRAHYDNHNKIMELVNIVRSTNRDDSRLNNDSVLTSAQEKRLQRRLSALEQADMEPDNLDELVAIYRATGKCSELSQLFEDAQAIILQNDQDARTQAIEAQNQLEDSRDAARAAAEEELHNTTQYFG